MKRLLFIPLLLTVLFLSCSDDSESTYYLDNNLITGKWYWIQNPDSNVVEFKNDHVTEYRYNKNIDELQQTIDHGIYKLSSKNMIYLNKYAKWTDYKLSKDTLYLEFFNNKLFKIQ